MSLSKTTLKQRLIYNSIEAINAIVELLSPEDAHEAIGILRGHLGERWMQTKSVQEPDRRPLKRGATMKRK